jgi:anti-sigma factor RsiW
MSVHEQFGEDLALHALGGLDGADLQALEKHLEACAACRRELEQLRGDSRLLALTTAGPRPPARARQRLMSAIANEPRLTVGQSAPAIR